LFKTLALLGFGRTRVIAVQSCSNGAFRSGESSGGTQEPLLGGQMERRAASDKDFHLRATIQKVTDQTGGRVVRGRFPIGVGAISKPVLIDFLAQGVGKNVKNIASLELDVVQSSNNVLMHVDRQVCPGQRGFTLQMVSQRRSRSRRTPPIQLGQ
jgi:hypothetical protein